ncbi:MAG: cysteine-rich CWC family protein [Comamonadaceae bacterium]|nr:cysteine-rich CWC family protein [Comamonadaceae bacterium]
MNTPAHLPAASANALTGVEAARCPLCGQPNGCALAAAPAPAPAGCTPPPCWCVHATFTPALLARVPADARRRACICAACAAAAA